MSEEEIIAYIDGLGRDKKAHDNILNVTLSMKKEINYPDSLEEMFEWISCLNMIESVMLLGHRYGREEEAEKEVEGIRRAMCLKISYQRQGRQTAECLAD